MARSKKTSFNDYGVEKDPDFVRPKTSSIDAKTRAALDELDRIETWAQFARVCEEQRRKRGY